MEELGKMTVYVNGGAYNTGIREFLTVKYMQKFTQDRLSLNFRPKEKL